MKKVLLLLFLPLAVIMGNVAACDEDDAECGNDRIEGDEVCDGADLDGQSCQSIGQGFTGGTLACGQSCDGWDTSACTTDECGDGDVTGAEVCDGTNLYGQDCQSIGLGFNFGQLGCNATCDGWDTSSCQTVAVGTIMGGVAVSSASVTCDASDTDFDCVGTVYVAVLDDDPRINENANMLAAVALPSVDLSDDATALYQIDGVPVGTWYLTGFMDDDANASQLAPAPDVDDPVVMPEQVTVTADATTMKDVTFVLRLP